MKGIKLYFLTLLVFIVLKMTGTVNWSWLWILSPLWIPFMIKLIIILALILFVIIGNKINKEKTLKIMKKLKTDLENIKNREQ